MPGRTSVSVPGQVYVLGRTLISVPVMFKCREELHSQFWSGLRAGKNSSLSPGQLYVLQRTLFPVPGRFTCRDELQSQFQSGLRVRKNSDLSSGQVYVRLKIRELLLARPVKGSLRVQKEVDAAKGSSYLSNEAHVCLSIIT